MAKLIYCGDFMLCAVGITKAYRKTVLQEINLSVQRGEIIGLAGINGSGKSTLLSVLVTAVKPDRGSVTLDGEDLLKNGKLLKKSLGFVPQESALFENLSVADNLRFWSAVYGKKVLTQEKSFLKKKVNTLSGGTKKKLALDIALMNEPDYLILDEPTTALDIDNREETLSRFLDLKKKGKSVIFSSHYAEELIICDRIFILNNGVLVYTGSPEGLGSGAAFKQALLERIRVNSRI